MFEENIDDLAKELIHALEEAMLIAPPSTRHKGFCLDDAYRVADTLFKWRCQNGEKSVGRKVGFTNQSIWEEHGLNTPIWAHIYESTVQYAQDNTVDVSLEGTVLPRIEPEIVFKLKNTPVPHDPNPCEILKHIEWLALGFEIVDAHYYNWEFSPADAVADFGVHNALVIGSPVNIEEKDIHILADQLESFQVTFKKDNIIETNGVGKDVLGNPASVLAHLQGLLSNQPTAIPLSPGEVITTGTITPALPISMGECWRADITGIHLPALEIQFKNLKADH